MVVSVLVQMSGTVLRQGGHVQRDLIVTDGQAVEVGTQDVFSFYYSKKLCRINIPYTGVLDGKIASIDVLSISNKVINHRIIGTEISLSLEDGIREAITLEGEYVAP